MKSFRFLALLLAVITCATVQAADSQLTSVTSILGELRVGITANSIPFSYTTADNDSPIGHQVELASQLAQDMGVGISFRTNELDVLVDDLVKGNIDIIMAGTPMNARLAQRAAYTQAWGRTGITPVTIRDAADRFRNWSDLRPPEVRIGVGGDQTVRSFLESIAKGKEITTIESSPAAIDALVNGEIDVFLTNTIEASVLARIDRRIATLFPQRSALSRPLACLVRIDDPIWLHYVNTWLTIKKETGFIASLGRKWGLVGQ